MHKRVLYINSLRVLLLALSVLLVTCIIAQPVQKSKKIVVDQKGKGDFKSIQAAINSLSDSAMI